MRLVFTVDLPEGSGTPAIIAASIEEEIYKEFKKTDSRYKNKVRSRVSNLRDKKNPALRENVLVGSISAERLNKMTPEVFNIQYKTIDIFVISYVSVIFYNLCLIQPLDCLSDVLKSCLPMLSK